MTTKAQNWRWINDTHEVPDSEKRDYSSEKDDLTFRSLKARNVKPEALDKEMGERYSAWLTKNS